MVEILAVALKAPPPEPLINNDDGAIAFRELSKLYQRSGLKSGKRFDGL